MPGQSRESARDYAFCVVHPRRGTVERHGGHVNPYAVDSSYASEVAYPKTPHRPEEANPLGRADAGEGPHERALFASANLDGHDERTLPGNDVELEMADTKVTPENDEPACEEIVCHRDFGSLAELAGAHVLTYPWRPGRCRSCRCCSP